MDTVYFDGCCPGGITTWGWALYRDGQLVTTGHESGKPGTTNEAEYQGLIAALEANPQRPLLVIGDSQLVIFQVLGQFRVRKQHLLGYRNRARALLNGAWLTWEPGKKNLADGVSRGKKQKENKNVLSR